MNGTVTFNSLVTGNQTVILSDILEKYEITPTDNVELELNLSKYKFIKDLFLSVSVHAQQKEANVKNTGPDGTYCNCSFNKYYKQLTCNCTHCKPIPVNNNS